MLFGLLFLTACLGAVEQGQVVECFEFDGERTCEETGGDIRINLPFSAQESEGWVVRFHPEDAERYGLQETAHILPNDRTGRTEVLFERSRPSPVTVCVNHDVFVQDVEAGRQIKLYESGGCTVGITSHILRDQEWVPI